jgi:thioredoxin reductase
VWLVDADGIIAAVAFRHTGDIVAGPEFAIRCDRAIVAIGELADRSYLAPSIRRTDDGHIASDTRHSRRDIGVFAIGETGMKGTMDALWAGFACGDAVDGALRSALARQAMR